MSGLVVTVSHLSELALDVPKPSRLGHPQPEGLQSWRLAANSDPQSCGAALRPLGLGGDHSGLDPDSGSKIYSMQILGKFPFLSLANSWWSPCLFVSSFQAHSCSAIFLSFL